ncbi:hypothetical protein Sta7437_4870 (plasmid) [Stanieria cyanosphaera PCC 7437]|uniref:Uncharacterized protein n=1 Tax=Stanieria cyanosphaera (strain ATCC 29371 / PCC 7437) TaxID=111780 RepID=K9Y0N0_STAC7|nr:hypothetical protein [Stanieria cyanosphaera]AFZ38298.1 hypothetical protein Sta7437_4870 [Stanieria cyanosphaera PCC 7437]
MNKAKDESTPETSTEESKEETGLTDGQLAELLGVSNLVLREYRVKRKKPPAGLLERLQEWEVKGEGWVKKS